MAQQKPPKTDAPGTPGTDQPAPQTADAQAPAAAPPEAAVAVEPSKDPQAEQIEKLCAELEQAKDRALRSHAELANYRKRAERQIEDERRYAHLSLLRDLLPVLDNVHRAIAAAEKSPETGSLLEGFQLVAGQLEGVLARYHCIPIDALHKPFDPHLHQAIAQQLSNEHPANTVLLVTQAGYQLHDRVVRPSQVIVSTSCE